MKPIRTFRKLQQISHRRLFEVKTFTDNIVLAIPDDHPDLKADRSRFRSLLPYPNLLVLSQVREFRAERTARSLTAELTHFLHDSLPVRHSFMRITHSAAAVENDHGRNGCHTVGAGEFAAEFVEEI